MREAVISKGVVKRSKNEKGSLALEQVLFIAAIVAMSAGIFFFYNNIKSYFETIDINAIAAGNITTGNNTNK